MLEMKLRHHWTDKSVDEWCRVSAARLPPGNLFPRSLHICMGIADCQHFTSVMHHVCPKGCCRFEDLRADQFQEHVGDECPQCGARRFKTGPRGALQPAAVVYDFGLAATIQDLFCDPDWCELRCKGRGTAGDYYSSTEAARLHAAAGADIRDHKTSVYELGIDWFQPFRRSSHSIGLVVLR
jgi:hypothetical protein